MTHIASTSPSSCYHETIEILPFYHTLLPLDYPNEYDNSVSVPNNMGLDLHQNGVAPSLGTAPSALEASTSTALSFSPSLGTPNSTARFPCATTGCERTFARAGNMRRHARKHDPAAERFPCQVAGCKYTGAKAFARKDKLADHVKKRHAVQGSSSSAS